MVFSTPDPFGNFSFGLVFPPIKVQLVSLAQKVEPTGFVHLVTLAVASQRTFAAGHSVITTSK